MACALTRRLRSTWTGRNVQGCSRVICVRIVLGLGLGGGDYLTDGLRSLQMLRWQSGPSSAKTK